MRAVDHTDAITAGRILWANGISRFHALMFQGWSAADAAKATLDELVPLVEAKEGQPWDDRRFAVAHYLSIGANDKADWLIAELVADGVRPGGDSGRGRTEGQGALCGQRQTSKGA